MTKTKCGAKMITSYQDYLDYLEADRTFLNRTQTLKALLFDEVCIKVKRDRLLFNKDVLLNFNNLRKGGYV